MGKIDIPRPGEEHAGVLDKNFTVSMRGILTALFVLVVLPGTFLLGRYVFPSTEGSIIESASGGAVTADVEAEQAEATSADETTSVDESKTQSTTGTLTTAKPVAKNDTKTTSSTTTTKSSTSGKPATSYDNVKLEFSGTPVFEWKGTYGKITTIYYRIINDEDGVIMPIKFNVNIKGYEKSDGGPTLKGVAVPDTDKKIPAGETREHGFDVSLTYRDVASNGQVDPTNVELTLELLDTDGTLMAVVTKSFNLKG